MSQIIKNLVIGLAITGASYQILKDQLTLNGAIGLGMMAIAIMITFDQIWPDVVPAEIRLIGMTKNTCAMQQVVRKLMTNHAIRTKFFLNSYLDNHLDKHIWHELLLENQKEIGNTLRPIIGNSKANLLTDVLTKHIEALGEGLAALYSNNPNRVKEALKKIYQNSDRVATVLTSLNPTKLPYSVTQRMFKQHNEYVVSMALARLEQNWQRDAQIYQQYYDQILEMADAMTVGLLN